VVWIEQHNRPGDHRRGLAHGNPYASSTHRNTYTLANNNSYACADGNSHAVADANPYAAPDTHLDITDRDPYAGLADPDAYAVAVHADAHAGARVDAHADAHPMIAPDDAGVAPATGKGR
jgi:hypothetical protein